MHRFKPARLLPSLLALSLTFSVGCASTPKASSSTSEDGRAPAAGRAGAEDTRKLFLYRVSRAGGPGLMYLLGSVHLQRPELSALDPAIEAALDEAEEVVVEVDVSSISDEDMLRITAEKAMLPPGESIEGHVSPETFKKLLTVAERHGAPPEAFLRLRPWAAAFGLQAVQFAVAGYKTEAGIEQLVLRHHRFEKRKRVSSLETMEYQLGLFAGLSEPAQEKFLVQVLDAILEEDDSMQKLEAAYLAGDEAALVELLKDDDEDDPELLALHRVLIHERNQNMYEGLLPYLEKDQVTFCTVGAGHVVGDGGLVDRFEKAGFDVFRVPGRSPPPKAAARPLGLEAGHEMVLTSSSEGARP